MVWFHLLKFKVNCFCVGGTEAGQPKPDKQSALLPPSLFALPADHHSYSKLLFYVFTDLRVEGLRIKKVVKQGNNY